MTAARAILRRRALLGGAAVTLAFPWLEAAAAPRSRAAPPRRLLAWYTPNGYLPAAWNPASAGPALDLSPTLAPLAPLAADILLIRGLANAPAIPDTPGDHATGTGAFLTAARPRRSESAVRAGVSVDQRIARALANRTRLPSLELGCEPGGAIGRCDIGYGCAYYRSVAWSSPTTPLPKLTDPRRVLDVLTAGEDPTAAATERARRRALRRSVLDAVLADAADLRAGLGAADRERVDAYLDGVRGLERQIDAIDRSPTICPEGPVLLDSSDLPAHVAAMTELMVLALRCDLTRVITFMLGNAASNRVHAFLGVQGGHHDLSHHAGDPAKKADLARVDAWQVACLAALLARLASTPEGDGRLLDRTLVYASSELGDGNLHAHDDLPVLVAGGGAWPTGRQLLVPPGTPLARLYVAFLAAFGVHEPFGDDGDRPLDGLA